MHYAQSSVYLLCECVSVCVLVCDAVTECQAVGGGSYTCVYINVESVYKLARARSTTKTVSVECPPLVFYIERDQMLRYRRSFIPSAQTRCGVSAL